MSRGKPIIIAGSGGFLHLAHQTPHGVQYMIDNWTSVGEAFQFCCNQQPRIRASYEIGDMVLLDRECQALVRMQGETMPLSAVALEIGTSIRAMKMSASRLRAFDLIAYDGEATTDSELSMTERGRDAAHALSG